jgi:hypothetical protein
MVANAHVTQNLCARTNVDIASYHWEHFFPFAGSNSNLMEDQAVRPNLRPGMNNYSIRMWYRQTPANFTVNRNISARHHTPESMAQYCPFPGKNTQRIARLRVTLVRPDAGQ